MLLPQFSDLNRPTDGCSRDVTYRIVAISICSLIGLGIVVGAVLAIVFCLYKILKAYQRAQSRKNMSEEEKKRLDAQIGELRKELRKALNDKSLDKKSRELYIKEIRKDLGLKRGRLAGDGSDEDD